MLSIINVLSNSLQNKTSRGTLGLDVVLGVIKTLESLRCEAELKKNMGTSKNDNWRQWHILV